jgi:hypothetical protein
VPRQLTRSETLIELLRTLHEARDPMAQACSETRTGFEDRLLLYNTLYRNCSSYARLEQTLVQQRKTAPRLYWAVSERYLRCDRRPREVWTTVRGKNGKRLREASWQVTETWHPSLPDCQAPKHLERVRKGELACVVCDGVAWLSEHFPGEPWLPRTIRENVAA